ncbi:hypothetical protein UCDDS831_g07489 [Diplodia seriata]|uniref:Uncharacterized protein n=1 Tax=Diplodia seriata TaxID=420778 RepID=A0A0G2DYS2_9PEZI|nr:hypothetical protein UCDDS831_g07489 [Diplodia seriata]
MDPEIRRIWSVFVGTARASLGVADNGKGVWATLTEDGEVEYRLEDGRLIAPDRFSYHSIFIKSTLRHKLVPLRERYIILKEAHVTGVLSESELIEISRDIRLLNIGVYNETKDLLPDKYLVKREAAFELFEKLYTRYPEAGAILNPYAVARAAGYSKLFQRSFPDSFSDDHRSDSFHLDVYILRALSDHMVYYDYIQKLIPYQSTALSLTLARKLKASIKNPTAFKKWKDAIDECIAKERFRIRPDVWARFKQHFPLESQSEIVETMEDE